VDIQPTLNDSQVMRFISDGYIVLERVVPGVFNRHCQSFPGGLISDPVQLAALRKEVLLHPAVAGIARSLLGPDFLRSATIHKHLYEEPHTGQEWHSDGLTEEGYGIHHLQFYYYPQSVELQDGPTMVLPGSHFRLIDRDAIAHYGDILGQVSLTVPAGTVALTKYGIWHRAGPKLNATPRGMIKFSYFRTAPPKRDWRIDSKEIPPFVNQPRHPHLAEVEYYRELVRCRKTWDWLCGVEAPQDVSRAAKVFVDVESL